MLNALRTSNPRDICDHGKLVESTKAIRLMSRPDQVYGSLYVFYRHCDAQGRVVHLDKPEPELRRDKRECRECTTEHVFVCPFGSILWMDYHPKEATLPNSIVPILAGRLTNGQDAYVVKADQDHFIHNSDQARAAPSVSLAILRYAPDAYLGSELPRPSIATPGEGLDATGPYSWKCVGNLSYVTEVRAEEGQADDGCNNSVGTDVEVFDSRPGDPVELQETEPEGTDDTDTASDVASFLTALEAIPAP